MFIKKAEITKTENWERIMNIASLSALNMVVNYVEKKFKGRLSQRFYTISQLKRMKHPYARRHYPLGYSLYKPGKAGVRLDIINKQTGKLLSRVRKEIVGKTREEMVGRVYIDPAGLDYIKYVFFGSSILIARPIHLLVKVEEEENAVKIYAKECLRSLRELAKRTTKTKKVVGK